MKRILVKPTSIKICDVGQDIFTQGLELSGSISEGTFSVSQAEVATEERLAENGDILVSVPSREPMSVTFNLADLGEEVAEKMFNRTLVTETINGVEYRVYNAKSAIKSLFKTIGVWFQSDNSFFIYPNVQTFDSLDLSNIGTEEAKNIVTGKLLPDKDGTIYKQVFDLPNVMFNLVSTTAITATGATINFTIALKGGITITESGVVYSTAPNPTTTTGTKKMVSTGGTTAGAKTVALTTLPPETKHYVRPYAMENGNTIYGTEISFTTAAS